MSHRSPQSKGVQSPGTSLVEPLVALRMERPTTCGGSPAGIRCPAGIHLWIQSARGTSLMGNVPECSELHLAKENLKTPPRATLSNQQPVAAGSWGSKIMIWRSVLGASRPGLIKAIVQCYSTQFPWPNTSISDRCWIHIPAYLSSPRPFAPFSNGEKDLFPGMWKKKAWEVGWSSKKEGRPIRHEKVWQLSLASRDIYEL